MNKLPLLLCLAFTACASPTGPERAEAAAQSMREAKQALVDTPDKVNAVTTSLDDVYKEGTDMKAAYGTFGSKVDALTSHRDYITALRKKIETAKISFLNEWDQRMTEIKDEDLRNRATTRKEAVVARFADLSKLADSARDEFNPWFEKVTNLRAYLANDLNPTGVSSTKDQLDKIKGGATAVNKKIKSLVDELEDMSNRIAAAKPPAPETKSSEASTKK